MRVQTGLAGLVIATTVVASCSVGPRETIAEPPSSATAIAGSAEARSRIEAVRERFQIAPVAIREPGRRDRDTTSQSVLGASVVTGFEASEGASVRAVIPPQAKRAVLRAASVELPMRANAMVRLEDDTTHVSVGFALRDAADAPIAVTDGIALYAGALGGSDVIHRVHAEGTEDFVVFEERPAKEELTYDVDVSRVAGLRLVSNTLEFLDDGGAPRLRVAPPYVVDATGVRSEAKLAVEGCAYDTNTSGPWGRAITRAGAASCTVRVAWAGTQYPLMVDPSWKATGSMGSARDTHTATLLPSGKVLVAGGGIGTASAELFDGVASFAATGSMTAGRTGHTATLLTSGPNAGKVLITGGLSFTTYLSSAELFDGVGTFVATGSMAALREFHTATLLTSGKVLITGGNNGTADVGSAELFDGNASFAVTGSMATARQNHTATLLPSGSVLIAGGYSNGGSVASAELFTGAAFTTTGAMHTARHRHTATLLPSGKVLVAGGNTGTLGSGNYTAGAELFDGSGTFVVTGSLNSSRDDHTATLLPSGQVLVAGGQTGPDPASAELFDGSTGFTLTASMTTQRVHHTATLLPSDQVLAAGGVNLSSAELYGPPLGGVCALASDCTTGICNERCCSSACAGTCMTCDVTGACVAVKSADDPNTCAVALNESSCDANGVCKKEQGQSCGANADCLNGLCANGFCCNSACTGAPCEVCASSIGTMPDGTCGPAQAGYPGSPTCGSGLACDGVNTVCPASCTSDLDCIAADYCAANGMCAPRKGQGAACNPAAMADCFVAGCHDCVSNNCVDGFCCDTACNGLCQACAGALKQSGMNDGTCGNAKAQTNPHKDNCTLDPSGCGNDGQCDGTGACSLFYPAGTSCGTSMCVAGNKVTGEICNGSGTCAADPGGVSCGDFVCAGGSCPASCSADTDCILTAYCLQGTCTPRTNGAACTAGAQCADTTFCVDGVCCNSACTDQCESCSGALTAGTCSPVVGAPVAPRAACATATAADPCTAASCDGVTTKTCAKFAGASTSCRGASCTNGFATAATTCDGTGSCPAAAAAVSCGAYACDKTGCGMSCTVATDCAAGNACTGGHCVPPASGGVCSGSIITAGTMMTDCSPFNCESGGTCRKTCASVDDCVAPNVCNASQQCVAPAVTADNSGDSGGCTFAPDSEGSPSRAALLLVLGLAVAARRRRRAARGQAAKTGNQVDGAN